MFIPRFCLQSAFYRLQRQARQLWQRQQCLLCLDAVQGTQAICEACEQELPWLVHGCQDCALPVPVGAGYCQHCQQQSYAFTRVIAPWHYAFPVSSMIGRFKYHAGWSYGRLLTQGLARQLQYLYQEQGLPRPDYLLAVPLARKRLRQRGYNQAQMITGWLAGQLQIPCWSGAVRRVRYTSIQQGLSASQRQLNMRGAFVVLQPARLAGRHVALIDDVLTTGATCAALARQLLACGVRRVDVYCLARTGFACDKTAAKTWAF